MNYRETEIQEALAYKERAAKEAAIPSERLKTKAILEQSDRENYYARRYANDEAVAAYGRFKQEVTDTLVAETVYCLAASCTDSMILENGYNKDLLRVLSTNFVNENGSQNLLRKWRGTSYIMSEFAYIIQNNIDSICEKADPKNQATLKIKDDQKKNDQAYYAGDIFIEADLFCLCQSRQQDHEHRRQYAKHDSGRYCHSSFFIVLEERARLLHRYRPHRLFEAVVHRRHLRGGRRFDVVSQKVVRADAEDLRHLYYLLHVRHRLGALPLGYRLPGYPESVGELLL